MFYKALKMSGSMQNTAVVSLDMNPVTAHHPLGSVMGARRIHRASVHMSV